MRLHALSSNHGLIQRGRTASLVAAAAYQNATQYYDDYNGCRQVYEQDSARVVATGLMAPEGAAPWLTQDPERFWNYVESTEDDIHLRRWKDLDVAQAHIDKTQVGIRAHFTVANELGPEKAEQLAQEFIRERFNKLGLVAGYAVHADPGNLHFHVLSTIRPLKGEAWFGARVFRRAEQLSDWERGNRAWLSERQNQMLVAENIDVRVEHRSFLDQGLTEKPGEHMGPVTAAITERGQVSERISDIEQNATQAAAHAAETVATHPRFAAEKLARDFHLTDATKTERQLRAAVLDMLQGDAEAADRLLPDVLADSRFVRLGVDADGEAHYTTKAYQEIENRLFVDLRGHALAPIPGVSPERVAGHLDAGYGWLTPGQRLAVEGMTEPGGVKIIKGRAGVGKTTMLKAAREIWEGEGLTVRGATIAWDAAQTLEQESGIRSQSVAELLEGYKERDRIRDLVARDAITERQAQASLDKLSDRMLTSGSVLVIDEAGQLGTEDLARITAAAREANARLVLVGDDVQFQSIAAGRAFNGAISEVGSFAVTEIRRQKADIEDVLVHRDGVTPVEAREIAAGMAEAERRELVRALGTAAENAGVVWRRDAAMMLAEWDVRAALDAWHERGFVHFAKTDSGAVNAAVDGYFEHLDRGVSVRDQDVFAFTNAEVAAVNGQVRAGLQNRGLVGRDLFETKAAAFAEGDRIVFSEGDKALRFVTTSDGTAVYRNARGTLTGYQDGVATVRLDDGRTATFRPDAFDRIEHGYARTLYKGQGRTVGGSEAGIAHIIASEHMRADATYVAGTRSKFDTHWYASERKFAGMPELATSLGRSPRKDLARDYAAGEGDRLNKVLRDFIAARRDYADLYSVISKETRGSDRMSAHPRWAELQDLKGQRDFTAAVISGGRERFEPLTRRAGLSWESIEIAAGQKVRPLTTAELSERRDALVYGFHSEQTRDLWNQIKRESARGRYDSHPQWERYERMREVRDVLAVDIQARWPKYRRWGQEAGISAQAVAKHAEAGRGLALTYDVAPYLAGAEARVQEHLAKDRLAQGAMVPAHAHIAHVDRAPRPAPLRPTDEAVFAAAEQAAWKTATFESAMPDDGRTYVARVLGPAGADGEAPVLQTVAVAPGQSVREAVASLPAETGAERVEVWTGRAQALPAAEPFALDARLAVLPIERPAETVAPVITSGVSDVYGPLSEKQNAAVIMAVDATITDIARTDATSTRSIMAARLDKIVGDDELVSAHAKAAILSDARLVQLGRDTEGEVRFTTTAYRAAERAFLSDAQVLALRETFPVDATARSQLLDSKYGWLSAGQRMAVEHMTRPSAAATVVGLAGVGKTTMMQAAREVWEGAGYEVRGAALSWAAAQTLEAESGIRSESVARVLHAHDVIARGRAEPGRVGEGLTAWAQSVALKPGQVLVLDEAGQLSTSELGRLHRAAAEAGAKVVTIGDDMQFQAIGAGKAFHGLVQEIGTARVTEIRRQKADIEDVIRYRNGVGPEDARAMAAQMTAAQRAELVRDHGRAAEDAGFAWRREASQRFADYDTRAGLAMHAARGHVHFAPDEERAMNALVSRYFQRQDDGVSLRDQAVYAFTNEKVDQLNAKIRAQLQARGAVGADEIRIGRYEFGMGDRIRFTEADRTAKEVSVTGDNATLMRNATGQIVGIDRAEQGVRVTVALDNGRLASFDPSRWTEVRHAYASTLYMGQGQSVGSQDGTVHVLASPHMRADSAYVAFTRSKFDTEIYASRTQYAGVPELADSLGRSPRKDLAADYEGDVAQFRNDLVRNFKADRSEAGALLARIQAEIGPDEKPWNHDDWKTFKSLKDSRDKLARTIADNRPAFEPVLRRAGLSWEAIEVCLNPEQRVLKTPDRLAKERFEAYKTADGEASRLWSAISASHPGKRAMQHPAHAAYARARDARDRLASEMVQDWPRHRRWAQQSNIAFAQVKAHATRHAERAGMTYEQLVTKPAEHAVQAPIAPKPLTVETLAPPAQAVRVGEVAERPAIQAAGTANKSPAPAAEVPRPQWVIPPTGDRTRDSLGRSLDEAAVRAAAVLHPKVQRHDEALNAALATAFRDPKAALKRIEEQTAAQGAIGTELALLRQPERFGELRGDTGLLVGRAARMERDNAIMAVHQASAAMEERRNAIELVSRDYRTSVLSQIDKDQIGVPALSEKAQEVARQVNRMADKPDRIVRLLAKQVPEVQEEFARFITALQQRFGARLPQLYAEATERATKLSPKAYVAYAQRVRLERRETQAGATPRRPADQTVATGAQVGQNPPGVASPTRAVQTGATQGQAASTQRTSTSPSDAQREPLNLRAKPTRITKRHAAGKSTLKFLSRASKMRRAKAVFEKAAGGRLDFDPTTSALVLARILERVPKVGWVAKVARIALQNARVGGGISQ